MADTNTKQSGSIPLYIQKLNSIEKKEQFRNLFHIILLITLSLSTIYFFIAYKSLALNISTSDKNIKVVNINEPPKEINKKATSISPIKITSAPLNTEKNQGLPTDTKYIPVQKKPKKPVQKRTKSNGITFELTPK